MNYQITRYPFDPVALDTGLNILSVEDTQLFFDFCQDFQSEEGKTIITSGGKQLVMQKNMTFFGDVTRVFDFNQLYLKAAIKTLSKNFDEMDLQQLDDLNGQINRLFTKVIFSSNLPIDLNLEFDLMETIKSRKIVIDMPILNTPYDKIRSTIDLAAELSDPHLLVFTNAFQYLTMGQTNQLAEYSRSMERNVLFLERFDSKIDLTEAANSYFFDKDFVQF
ncbi:type II-A CRISPR-associated protein Csn2 [Oenococcus kitaharae]|uniref:Csn2 family CRISPR-associated protein n=1 Tax=Oenococcus kitaharae DSM 17330 TaxID=1045004 RepID=G9WGU7_9LACO|nr:type II-A CRISPR-associated protein Csn2 [Oenococcus kitaharae]EHN59355.1 Csn2 family CRISPR-associated protein [Oenococcus kitaharae DSM 17330]OEY82135.1 hypothetical protein NT96_06965 [Oenococcus kitaharae]OEY82558.1 hypothetical protein NV75_07410 [Oenococcus kitaharae]